ncbi:MAG TPA: helix-turn-helix domain-containing protein [Thermoanaerobaculia bacterium]|jgi:DNA-binding transcriptional MerR regulator|nr:helix-turn-helix domain-containing protein [Thermoanaerobaculia bacterium]
MAKEDKENAGQRLLTLTAVSKRTGISMPTLQKYKKRYAARIPSQGKGRTQRYPESSLPVFSQLRDENMARRGRPRKNAAAPVRRRGRAARKGRAVRKGSGQGEGLLTLTQVAQRTKISYPTLLRYVKTSLDRIPHVGSGRRRRFKSDAVGVFQQLRASSRPGRPRGSGKAASRRGAGGARHGRPPGSGRAAAAGAMAGLGAILKRLEQRLARVEEQLKKPLRVEVRR